MTLRNNRRRRIWMHSIIRSAEKRFARWQIEPIRFAISDRGA
jgi:hypothetical protein